MPYNYQIDIANQKVEVAFTGRLTGQEVLEVLQRVFFDDDWSLSFPHYWDGSGVTQLDFGFSDFEMITPVVKAIQVPQGIKPGPMAVIVANRVAYGIVRAAHAALEKGYKPFGIFKKRADADLWINDHYATKNIDMLRHNKILWQSA